jgi:hypothetical protein
MNNKRKMKKKKKRDEGTDLWGNKSRVTEKGSKDLRTILIIKTVLVTA